MSQDVFSNLFSFQKYISKPVKANVVCCIYFKIPMFASYIVYIRNQITYKEKKYKTNTRVKISKTCMNMCL